MGNTITTGILTASPTPLYSSLTDAVESPVTIAHGSLIVRAVAYYLGDHSLKLQGFIGIVALQGSSGSIATVFLRWAYSLYTFDRVLRNSTLVTNSPGPGPGPRYFVSMIIAHCYSLRVTRLRAMGFTKTVIIPSSGETLSTLAGGARTDSTA